MLSDFIPYRWIDITSDVDLTPATFTDSPVYKLWCTKTNTDTVTITYFDDSTEDYPAGSFVIGAIYPGLVKKVTFDAGVCGFKGALAHVRPYDSDVPSADGYFT